jgi:hypothetical protein
MRRCGSISGILVAILVLCVPAAWAQDGLGGALSRAGSRPRALLGLGNRLAPADFDNDDRLDAAILLQQELSNGQTCFRIELHVTAGTNHAITFSSAESGLAISTIDVNRDGAPDIVIERELTHERLQVFLNDGHGNFHTVRGNDYPSPESPMRLCQKSSGQRMPFSVLITTRGLELHGLRWIATVVPAGERLLNGVGDGSHSPWNALSPLTARAPPSAFLL